MKIYLKRFSVLVLGLIVLAMGVGVSAAARLGVSPVSCVPFVLSQALPLTMGTITIIMHIVFLVAQIIILRKDFNPFQLLQIVVVFVFGYFTDAALSLTKGINPQNYFMQWVYCILSCPIIALGVALEVKAAFVTLPMEGFVGAISKKTGQEFGKAKTIIDICLVVLAAALSLIFLGKLNGVREGTIFAAITIGIMVRFITPYLSFLDHFLELKK